MVVFCFLLIFKLRIFQESKVCFSLFSYYYFIDSQNNVQILRTDIRIRDMERGPYHLYFIQRFSHSHFVASSYQVRSLNSKFKWNFNFIPFSFRSKSMQGLKNYCSNAANCFSIILMLPISHHPNDLIQGLFSSLYPLLFTCWL